MPIHLFAQTPTDSQPQLGLTEPPPYQVGQTIDLFGAFLPGPADALDAVLTVTVTPGTSFLSVTAVHPTQPLSCNLNSPQEVVCTRDVVRGSTEIFISMRFDQPGDHTLTATVSQSNPDPNPSNNTIAGTITVEGGDTPGAISGMKWHDLNQNGQRDADEPGLAGWTIYVDDNGNAQFDGGEPSATTGGDGSYQIDNLDPDTYTVREVLQDGWEQTFPAGGAHAVTVDAGSTTAGIDFGNIEIVQMADLSVMLDVLPLFAGKVADDTIHVTVGDTVLVMMIMDHNGSDDAGGVLFAINLDGSVTPVAGSLGDCDGRGVPSMPNDRTLQWEVGQVADGETIQCTAQLRTTERGEAAINGTVTSTTTDPDLSNNTDGVFVSVEDVMAADLVVEKSVSPDTVFVGDTLTYALTVTNNGPDEATNVFLRDLVFNDSLMFVPGSVPQGCTPTANNGQLDCNIGFLGAGGTVALVYQALAKQAGTVTNLASVASTDVPDPNIANNSTSVRAFVRGGADLSIEKAATVRNATADTVGVGAVITYTVIVTNNGPETAFLVETDDLVFADSLEFVASTVPQNCDLGTATDDDTGLMLSTMNCRVAAILDAGESRSVTYQALTKKVGTVSNQVEVEGAPRDLNPSNNIAITTTVVEATPMMADLSVEKTALPDTVFIGEIISYALFVTNSGPEDAANVRVSDSIFTDSLMFVLTSLPQGCVLTQNGAQMDCTIPSLLAGETVPLTYQAIPKLDGTVTNFVGNLASDLPDPNFSNNTARTSTVVLPHADLSIQKTVETGPGPVMVGDTLRYALTVTNNGPSRIDNEFTGIRITDRASRDSLQFLVSSDCVVTIFFRPTAQQVECFVFGPFEVGESKSITYKAIARRAGMITNVVELDPMILPDRNPANNTASVTTVVGAETTTDYTLQASASPPTANVGDEVTFSFSLSADGVTENGRMTITTSDAWTDPMPMPTRLVVDGDTMAVAAEDSVTVEVDPEGLPAGTTRITYTYPDGFPDGRRYDGSLTLTAALAGASANKSQDRAAVLFEAFVPGNDDPNPADDVVEVFVDIEDTSTAIEPGPGGEVAQAFLLHPNYPNPFNPETVIRFDLKERAQVRLQVFNLLGQVVETLVDDALAPGSYRSVFDAQDLPSGSYFYRLEAGTFSQTKPMVLLK